jgi:hypothetical protein
LRQASAIDYDVPSTEPDGADIRLEQLADLADALVEQVGAVRAHYEGLQRTLEEPAPAIAATPVERRFPQDDGPDEFDAARLVAMEMAMSGSSRGETKAYLHDALHLDGGDPIVDEVFERTEAAQESAPLHRRLFTRRRD